MTLGVFTDFLIIVKIVTSNAIVGYFDCFSAITHRKCTNIRTFLTVLGISTLMRRGEA